MELAPRTDRRSVTKINSYDSVVAMPTPTDGPDRFIRVFGREGLVVTSVVPVAASWSRTFALTLVTPAPEVRYETAATYDLETPPLVGYANMLQSWVDAYPVGPARDAALALALAEVDAVHCSKCGVAVGWNGDGFWDWTRVEVPVAGGARYTCEGCAV